MKKALFLLLVLAIAYHGILKAQGFTFGLKNQTSFYSTEKFNAQKNKIFPLSSIYFVTNYALSSNQSLLLVAGYNNAGAFQLTGIEAELNYSNGIGKNFYLNGGINLHLNLPSNPVFVSRTILFTDLGLGYKLNKNFSFDLLYYFPLNKTYVKDPKCDSGCDYTVNYSLRFGITGYIN